MPDDRLELRKSNLGRIAKRTAAVPLPSTRSKELVPTGTGPLPLIEDDKDLVPLLRQASNEELAPLVEYIIENGGVTAQLHRTQKYRQYSASGEHARYADDIAAEIQKYGANTFWTNIIREGRGVRYREVLKNVAKRCGAKAHLWDETVEIEERVLAAVLSKTYERMTNEERLELLKTLKIHQLPGAGALATAGALQGAIQATGFAPYKVAVIVANGAANAALGHGLAFGANAALTKGLSLFAGPVGLALDAMWGGAIIAGPAYRVTMPCVVQVALIRQSRLHQQREKWRKFLLAALITFVCIMVALVARHLVK